MRDKDRIRKHVRRNYGNIASKGSVEGCCSGGCSCNGELTDIRQTSVKIGYAEEDLVNVPAGSNMGLGCGNPIAIANLKEGEIVLDLGCGGGFDCFLANKKVGETGLVIGVDMTFDMISLARKNAEEDGYTNVEFRLGEIEHLPVADESIDVIISNCVINLSPEKEKVFQDAYRVLKPGGRLSISDVVATAELPEDIKMDLSLMTGCIAGAEYVEDIRKIMEEAGFNNIKLTPKDNGKEIVKSWVPDRNVEDYVTSYIIEASKQK
ncbi:arsenite methyltransferase [Tissierella sp. Yu-01]|jgi:SAM-dependent methyltransferase|uniref:arsenite methyltransferase n=1 Tax=Tissierella sp. Yu-01 TaxID=3035694 RepID=UPI00240E5105|nr:arsenite methyltransferase [Tissierella sp. Yu-01]WFA08376.1 arsenite methyltransferase [Tissierella sp. Yu-01]